MRDSCESHPAVSEERCIEIEEALAALRRQTEEG
jgi:hypothetical protein